MSFGLTSPVTGGAQTGLTSPTYTLLADTAPDVNAKQWAVSALGGTQTNVSVHSVASPFTISFWKPKVFAPLGKAHPVTGVIADVKMNTYKCITRKGVTPLTGQPFKNLQITTIVEVPAGSDTADSEDVRAALSLHIGALTQQSAGIGDTAVSGII